MFLLNFILDCLLVTGKVMVGVTIIGVIIIFLAGISYYFENSNTVFPKLW